MGRLSFVLFILAICATPRAYAKCSPHIRPDWTASAIRLTGESEKSRENASKEFKVFPNLIQVLRFELRCENCFLALDVVSAVAISGSGSYICLGGI